MDNLIIRNAEKRDKETIDALATKIWDDDYLGRQFDKWIEDGNFFVAEIERKVVGCAKISILPSKTGWLEGLRVDPAFHKMGIGREFNRFMFNKISEMKSKGIVDSVEFSTYYKNFESLHMGDKAGFRVIEKFIVLALDKSEESINIEKFKANRIWFNDYEDYIPAGWKFVRNNSEGVMYIMNNCEIYKNNKTEFYTYRDERTFCFFEKNINIIIDSIPYMRSLARVEAEIMIPASWSDMLPVLFKNGFYYWHEPHEANVFVLRLSK